MSALTKAARGACRVMAVIGLVGGGALVSDVTLAGAPVSAAATAQSLGRPASISRAPAETVAQIMARTQEHGPSSQRVVPAPRLQPGRARLPENPTSLGMTALAQPQSPQVSGPAVPAQTASTQFLGAQLSDSGFIPPDSMGAAGPTQFVVVVNGRIRSFTKSTGTQDGVLDMSTDSFFASVSGNSSPSDPRIRYDRLSGRWFISMVTTSMPSNRVLFAFSNGSTISSTSNFTFASLNVATNDPNCFWDYDTLGVDVNALYVGGNLFCGLTSTFSGSNGLVVQKAALVGSGQVVAHEFALSGSGSGCPSTGEGPYTPQGVDNYDASASLGYFVGVSSCFFGQLDVVRVSAPGGSNPAASIPLHVSVPATCLPIAVPAQGSIVPLDALDDRLFAAHLRNGHLWTAHNISVDATGASPALCNPPLVQGDRDASRWYDIVNLDTTPSLNQSGTVFDNATSNPRSYWIPSIMVSGQGHAAMGTSAAGAAEHAEAATMGRWSTDPLGTMKPATIYQASNFAYNLNDGASPHRWGDYSFTSVDPGDDMTMWSIQEFTNATNSWGVEVAKLLGPPPATPSSVASGPIYVNEPSQVVAVTGASANGSEFFDPGPGFTGRLHASVSGGVSVNSVSYIDPTHVNVNISTTGAGPGPEDLTITNPDGQSVTATGFINVLNAPAAVSTLQYHLTGSDGATWQEMDAGRLRLVLASTPGQPAVLTANADLWTASAGYNQDIGIFASDNGAPDQLLAWKESGGFAGTLSPNAAYIQWLFSMAAGHTYTFKLKWKTNIDARSVAATIYAGAGPINGQFSPTSLVAVMFPSGSAPNFVASTQQPTMTNSNGSTWQALDPVNMFTTLAPGSNSTALLGANADLSTAKAGYNQDIGIFVSDNGGADQLVAWKESGGYAGTFSPNAAFVRATYPMVGGHTYAFKLRWKTNQDATGTGAIIYAGAGPINGQFSPTTLLAETIPAGANTYAAVIATQPRLIGSDGSTWQAMDPGLSVTVNATSTANAIVGANADLWTATAGYNQDIAIFVTDNGGPRQLLTWKESGGIIATFSPNAAFAQATYLMVAGHTYVFEIDWKTNINAHGAGATIYAGAGPIGGLFSPTRLTIEMTN